MDEARVSELTDIFKELADTAGGYERTRIMPNLEVIDASPSNLPANFIIIKDDEGFYIPALRVAGMTYTTGDLVNVLFIKGTEPIAFQQGSGSSAVGYALNISDEGVDQGVASTLDFVGANISAAVAAGVATISAGGGWPFAHALTVSPTDTDADYPDIPAAITAAAASGDNIELDPNTYVAPNVAGGITIDESLALVGKSPQETIITRADNSSVTVTVADTPVTLRNLTLSHTGAGAGTSTPLSNDQASLVLDNCYLLKSGASGNSIGLSQGGGDSLLRNCKISATNGTVLNYAVYLHTAASTCILDGGEVLAGALATGHVSAVIELRGVRLASGVTLDVSGGGTIRGWYIDSNGNMVIAGVSDVKGVGSNFPDLGTTTAAEKWGAIYQGPAKDIFPDDDRRGLAARFIHPAGYDDHFRSGSIPTSYAWKASSGYFSGTPTILSYNHAGEYMQALSPVSGTAKHFLARAITNSGAAWQNQSLFARVKPTNSGTIGILVDNGNAATDQPYFEIYLTDNANGTMTIYVSHKDTVGGGVTTVTGATVPSRYLNLQIFCSYGGGIYTLNGYVEGEDGIFPYISGVGSLAWMPAAGSAGVFLKGNNNWQGCDLIRNTFG